MASDNSMYLALLFAVILVERLLGIVVVAPQPGTNLPTTESTEVTA
jgi:hypothetical protein